MVELLIAYVIGLVCGTLVVFSIRKNKSTTMGVLRIDRSIPDEEPYLFLEIDKGTGDISKYDNVTFKVVNEDYMHS